MEKFHGTGGRLRSFGILILFLFNFILFATINPPPVLAEFSWTQVVAGWNHSVALRNDGTLWTWGQNNYGQLGNGSNNNASIPLQIGNETWQSIAAGDYHTLAIRSDGSLWAWGWNYYGQLGKGDKINSSTPVQIGTDTDWIAVAAGFGHSMAIKKIYGGEGSGVYTWGSNNDGELGTVGVTERLSPGWIDNSFFGGSSSIKQIAANWTSSFAIDNFSNSLWAWGQNVAGQLGLGDTATRTSPTIVPLPHVAPTFCGAGIMSSWDSVIAGYGTTFGFANCSEAKFAFGWGDNDWGQVGDGSFGSDRLSPVLLIYQEDYDVKAIAAGQGHAHAIIGSLGSPWGESVNSWGLNAFGELGSGYTNAGANPSPILTILPSPEGVNWTKIASYGNHTFALNDNGQIWGWGPNQQGNLGIGSIASPQPTPKRICSFEVSLSSGSIDAGGGIGSMILTESSSNNCPWSASSPETWISNVYSSAGSPETGSSMEIFFDYLPNPGPGPRTGIIKIAGYNYRIEQDAPIICTYLLNPSNNLTCLPGGCSGNFSVTVGIGCPWTATTSYDWIYIDSQDSGTVNYHTDPNPNTSPRTGTITVDTQTFTITQAPIPETVSMPNAPSGPSNGVPGTSYTFSTGGSTSNYGHSVQYQFNWGDGNFSEWLSVGTTSASHSWTSPGVKNITVQARCSTDTGIVSTISTSTEFSVCSYTISPGVNTIPGIGGTGSVEIITVPGCSWTATNNDPSWITIISGSGTGGGLVSYSVAANWVENAHYRSGSISISDKTHYIDQAPLLPGIPTLDSPQDGATGVPVSPTTLSWNTAERALTYELEIATDSGFTENLITEFIDGNTIFQKEIFSLSNSTQYFWRIRAGNSGGPGPFSDPRSFTTVGLVYDLTINVPNHGIVKSLPAGIYCNSTGADCAENFAQGTVVSLQAIPDDNAYFSGWSGGCTGQSLNCLVTMDAAKTVTAQFTQGVLEINTWAKGFNLNGPFSAIQTQDGGYLLSGHNAGMVFIKLNAANNNLIDWQVRYGDSYDDAKSIRQTADGGFVIAGRRTNSFVLKISSSGAFGWQKEYPTGNISDPNSMVITADGGFVIAGTNRGGTNPNSPEDIWISKLDAQGGVEWSKSLSSPLNDIAYVIIQTSDRGYLVGGSKNNTGDTTIFYLVKLFEDGTVDWQKSYKGSDTDVRGAIRSLQQTSDGNYIVAGDRTIFGFGPDTWILKLTPSGEITWQKSYDLNYDDYVRSIVQTTDGGYLVGGSTRPFTTGHDFFILRLDAAGNPLWNRRIDTPSHYGDDLDTLQETSDKGILVEGSFYFDEANTFGVFKLDSDGNTAGCASGMISEGTVAVSNTNITPIVENLISQDLTITPNTVTPAPFIPTLAATEICTGGFFETITTPGAPTGQTSVFTGFSYPYSTTGSSSSAGHAIQYSFDFGDGTSSGWQDAPSFQKAWTAPGTHNVTVQARCNLHPVNLSLISAPLAVTVSLNTFSITASAGAGGSIIPSGTTMMNAGSNLTYTITPDTGNHVAHVLVDGVSIGAVTSYTFLNVTADHTIAATFAINTYTLTYTAGTDGTIQGTTPQTVNYGADASAVTAVPNPGYYFVNWSDGKTDNPRTDINVTTDISVSANFVAGPPLQSTATPAGGSYNTAQTVTLAQINGQPGAIIYYTTDGTTDPTVNGTAYTAPIPISADTTLKYAAYAGGLWETPVKTEVYTFNAALGGSLPATISASVNGPIPITMTFNNNTGSAITTITPDCFNTFFEVIDQQGNLLPALCRIPTAYGIPNDVGTIPTGLSTLTCNLADMYDPSILGSLVPGSYTVRATYSNYIQDPDLVNGTCHDPDGECTTLWTGAIAATPATIILSNTFTLTYNAGAGGSILGSTIQTVTSGNSGSQVTAVPNPGYYFVNWSDGLLTASRTDSNVTTDISVSANFAINTFTLTYIAGANGTIQGTTPQTVNYGADASAVTAVPNPGCYFVSWSDGKTDNPRTDINVTAHISVTANFVAGLPLQSSATPAGGSYNTVQTVTLAQINGQPGAIIYYTLDGNDPTTSSPTYSAPISISANTTLTFAAYAGGLWETLVKTEVYTFNANLGGSLPETISASVNGPIPITMTFNNNTGSAITTITPDCFNTFFEVIDQQGNLLPALCRIPTAYGIPNDVGAITTGLSTLTCNLADMYDPSILGSLVPGSYTVRVTYSNYIQDPDLVNGTCHDPDGECTTLWTGAIAATPATITLSNPFTLTYNAGAGGSISGSTIQTVTPGNSGSQVTAVPNPGYYFVKWSDGLLTASRTDSNIMADISVTANFAINTCTITASAGTGGTISPSGVITLNTNTNQTFTFTPDTNCVVDNVFVDGQSMGRLSSYTFLNVTTNHTISVTFKILYNFTGFFSPVQNPPEVNSANAGQTIPIKWRLTTLNGTGVSDSSVFSLVSHQVSCLGLSPLATNITLEALGSSGLQYLGDGNWQFNWKTPKSYRGQCWEVKLILTDGSAHSADFKFK